MPNRSQYHTPHPRNPNPHARYQRRHRQRISAPSIYISIHIPEFITLPPLTSLKFKAYVTLDKFSPNQPSPDLVYYTQLTRYMGIKLKTFTCCLSQERDTIAEVTLTNTRKDMPFNFPDLVLNNIMAMPKTRLNKLDSKYNSNPQPSSRDNETMMDVSSSQAQSNGSNGSVTPYSPSKALIDSPPYSPSVRYTPTPINGSSHSEEDQSNDLLDFPDETNSTIQTNSPYNSNPSNSTQHSTSNMPTLIQNNEDELVTPPPSLFPPLDE